MPPYVTPPLGEGVPDEMQKDADQIYRELRETTCHEETTEAKGAAAGTMWKRLEYSWRWDEERKKWFKRSKSNTAVTNASDDADGNWITINGEHILIKGGESVEKAFERTTGKPLSGGSDSKGKEKEGSGGGKGSESPKSGGSSPSSTADHDKDLVKSMNKSSNKKVGTAIAEETDKSLTEQTAYGKTFAEDESINHYTALGYAPTNAYLRGQTTEEQAKRTGNFRKGDIENIDKAIAGSPDLPEGTTLYRGVGERGVESMMNMKPGDTCNDKGFQSFSTSPYNANTFTTAKSREGGGRDKVLVRAVTSSGMKGFVVGGGEHEIIMPRGTGWKVVSNNAVTTGANAGRVTTHVITVVPA